MFHVLDRQDGSVTVAGFGGNFPVHVQSERRNISRFLVHLTILPVQLYITVQDANLCNGERTSKIG